ncbi:MAG: FtsX-like permease family protein [Elusimicrobia bacterium]|nr:FtsX-like permease family protein [Elusimicrobiota bacterium]
MNRVHRVRRQGKRLAGLAPVAALAFAAAERAAGPVHAGMAAVAMRNLLHDKVRFLITLAGITVAIVLIFLQGGMYLGFMKSASGMIDRTDADVWVVSRNSPNFDWSRPFPERYLNKARSTPGVAEAKTLIFGWGFLRLPGGGTEQVEIIGYHPPVGGGWGAVEAGGRAPRAEPAWGAPRPSGKALGGWGEPSGFVSGDASSVLGGDNIILDESGCRKLGGLSVGDTTEIMGHEARVTGMTRGLRSLTTAPYVFASYGTAKKLISYIGERNTVFILARAEPGVSPTELKRRLAERLPNVDVLTKSEYSRRTKLYWTIQTGMGFGFLMMTFLAFVVGLAIVGQTVYAATMEHLREYATLKALGATDSEVRTILWSQAAASALLGYVLSIVVVWWLARALEGLGLPVAIPPWLYAAVFCLGIVLCLAASVVSVRKALSLDPAMVFRA